MIRIDNVTKIFGKKDEEFYALKNITLNIAQGECVLLRGGSGGGKSTLLSIIGGLLKPTSGNVVVDGIGVAKVPDDFATLFRREHIGFIFQKYNLIGNLNVFDNVSTPLLPTSLTYGETVKKVEMALKIANISHKSNTLARNLSGGEQQRVAIARAIVNSPKIILADEPSANLDMKLTIEFLKEMEAVKSLGKTIIIASHDEILLKSNLFDRVITLREGSIVDTN